MDFLITISLLLLTSFSLEPLPMTEALGIGCKDFAGNTVDWFIIYKLPKDAKRRDLPLVSEGLAHLYLDSKHKQWQYMNVSLNDSSHHSLAFTLNTVFAQPNTRKSVSYLLYNDQLPNGTVSFTHGHSKGVVVFDSTSGFWLVHSLPHFPHPDGYSWPHTGRKYGQTFICITYPYEYLNKIGEMLLYNDPLVYDSNLLPQHVAANPNIKQVISGSHVQQPPWNRTQVLFSVGKQPVLVFAKYSKFNKDLYSAWMSDYLNSKLLTETWQDGPGDLPSACDIKYQVENIKQLEFNSSSSLDVDVGFSNSKDHSKWAVTDELSDSTWICVGDINRQQHQFTRGGGSVCINDWHVWRAFYHMIRRTERCDRHLPELRYWQ